MAPDSGYLIDLKEGISILPGNEPTLLFYKGAIHLAFLSRLRQRTLNCVKRFCLVVVLPL